jgi:hypothetical protein
MDAGNGEACLSDRCGNDHAAQARAAPVDALPYGYPPLFGQRKKAVQPEHLGAPCQQPAHAARHTPDLSCPGNEGQYIAANGTISLVEKTDKPVRKTLLPPCPGHGLVASLHGE